MQYSIVLLGYMGSGKSALGKQLSIELSRPFIDLDDYIEKKENQTIAAIFKLKGELYFRKLERQCLEELLNKKNNAVIGLGGGTPCYFDNMDLILNSKNVLSIYLKTSIQELTKRLFDQKERRPMIAHVNSHETLMEFIGKHLFERARFYEKAALKIQTDKKSIVDLVPEIIKVLA